MRQPVAQATFFPLWMRICNWLFIKGLQEKIEWTG